MLALFLSKKQVAAHARVHLNATWYSGANVVNDSPLLKLQSHTSGFTSATNSQITIVPIVTHV